MPPPESPASPENPRRTPLYYTFGNHMHWADMQWLWGYDVLPGSVADMLRLCEATGARGNVNFDAVGYEKMAAECPEALASLRAAVERGEIEPVGCSYGQPYGQFHGGESNIRQLTYGLRATRRLLGVRPRTFWEEEFYFFPQLPQLLRSCGYTGACLFFQWTWHTAEVPREPHSLILWEGIDGSRLPALPRNDLNLHQWPEDFDGLLESGHIHARPAEHGPAAIVQWLELMPSRDWMCRSEVLLPRLRELMGDARFQIRARTAGGLIEELSRAADHEKRVVPVRQYKPDDVWHGMTLGKNADAHPRASRAAERAILAAESISALAGLFGRPYASWDVYPTWELDEAWRNTLAAQHHDNHECEGLCGFVGHQQFSAAMRLAGEVEARAQWLLAHRALRPKREDCAVFNGLGWPRAIDASPRPEHDEVVPPFGYATGRRTHRLTGGAVGRARSANGRITLWRGDLHVEIDEALCAITQIRSRHHPDGLLGPRAALLGLSLKQSQKQVTFDRQRVIVGEGRPRGGRTSGIVDWSEHDSRAVIRRRIGPLRLKVAIDLAPELDAVDVSVHWRESRFSRAILKPDPGLNAALKARFAPDAAFVGRADSQYAVSQVRGSGACRRKYPTGDWMTSPQWFETVQDPFTAVSFVDLCGVDGGGLLIAHDGSQQWFHEGESVSAIITAYDPWDEQRYADGFGFGASFRLVPHAGLTDAQRVQVAAEFSRRLDRWPPMPFPSFFDHSIPVGGGTAGGVERDAPEVFGALEVCGAPGVLAHAFCRDSMRSGENLPDWAGHRMAAESNGACTHPYVIRLVEWNGEPAEVTLKLPGQVALAAKTNLMGEVGPGVAAGEDTAWLKVEPADPPDWARGAKLKGEPIPWSQVRFRMRPREVATVMADLVLGRKQFRDLDARRDVWATVHRA